MAKDRTRKIVITGVLGAITVLLAFTPLGFIPWFTASLTILTVPAIIGAVLEGPVVGFGISLIFGLSSLIRASMPNSPLDPLFKDPLISVLPRIFIGPMAWVVWSALKKWPIVGLIGAGITGSLTNTILVLGMIGIRHVAPWIALPPIVLANGLPEAGASALITLLVVSAWRQIKIGKRKGSNI